MESKQSKQFKVGDRVTRFVTDDIYRHGVIVEICKGKPNHLGEAIDLYGVQWDDSKSVSPGYMELGLFLEEHGEGS
jgi:hypothetical protein